MSQCRQCGSHAINPHLHGREAGVDLNLCDVCYWRKKAELASHTALIGEEPVAWTTMPDADDWVFVSGAENPNGHLPGAFNPLFFADQLATANAKGREAGLREELAEAKKKAENDMMEMFAAFVSGIEHPEISIKRNGKRNASRNTGMKP